MYKKAACYVLLHNGSVCVCVCVRERVRERKGERVIGSDQKGTGRLRKRSNFHLGNGAAIILFKRPFVIPENTKNLGGDYTTYKSGANIFLFSPPFPRITTIIRIYLYIYTRSATLVLICSTPARRRSSVNPRLGIGPVAKRTGINGR